MLGMRGSLLMVCGFLIKMYEKWFNNWNFFEIISMFRNKFVEDRFVVLWDNKFK